MSGRIVVAVAVLGALVGTGCNDTKSGAVRLTIQYSGFVPGCIRVKAEDAAAASKSTEQTLTPTSDWDGQLVVAVYRRKDWSENLKVTASAHEQSCTGAVVATQTATSKVVPGQVATQTATLTAVDLDQDGWVALSSNGTDCDDERSAAFPGATEVCNHADDDCDGAVDDNAPPQTTYADVDGDGHGAGAGIEECGVSAGRALSSDDCNDNDPLAYPDAPERCNTADDDCDGVVNNGITFFPTYADVDLDGFGTGAATQECAVSSGRARDAGDCNDNNGQIHPGAPERCDAVDNDCSGQADEPFAVGTSCPTGKTCAGAVACDVDGGTRCTEIPLNWYVDFDSDQRGALDAGFVSACDAPVGYVAASADCDDGDPFTFAAADEICDRKDNDCDGQIDELGGSCDGGWVLTQLGGNNNDWKTAAAVDAGWWWMGGRDSASAPNGADLVDNRDGGWADRFQTCQPASEWSGSWAYQSASDDSTVLLAGCVPDAGVDCVHGALAMASTKNATCIVSRQQAGVARMKSVVGIRELAGLRVFAVGTGGTAFEAHPTTLAPLNPTTVAAILNDVHGVSSTTVYAVGATTNGSDPLVFHYDESGSPSWNVETEVVALSATLNGQLLSVWVVSPDLVFAGGENGMVLRKLRGHWSAMTAAPGGRAVRSIRAFGLNSVYIAADQEAYRWTGSAWQQVYNGNDIMTDIAGVRPDELILVGDNGDVVYSKK